MVGFCLVVGGLLVGVWLVVGFLEVFVGFKPFPRSSSIRKPKETEQFY